MLDSEEIAETVVDPNRCFFLTVELANELEILSPALNACKNLEKLIMSNTVKLLLVVYEREVQFSFLRYELVGKNVEDENGLLGCRSC